MRVRVRAGVGTHTRAAPTGSTTHLRAGAGAHRHGRTHGTHGPARRACTHAPVPPLALVRQQRLPHPGRRARQHGPCGHGALHGGRRHHAGAAQQWPAVVGRGVEGGERGAAAPHVRLLRRGLGAGGGVVEAAAEDGGGGAAAAGRGRCGWGAGGREGVCAGGCTRGACAHAVCAACCKGVQQRSNVNAFGAAMCCAARRHAPLQLVHVVAGRVKLRHGVPGPLPDQALGLRAGVQLEGGGLHAGALWPRVRSVRLKQPLVPLVVLRSGFQCRCRRVRCERGALAQGRPPNGVLGHLRWAAGGARGVARGHMLARHVSACVPARQCASSAGACMVATHTPCSSRAWW